MGCQITDLLIRKEIDIKNLKGKIIAIDSHIFLYQFLTTIRQPDGNLLTDSKGNVTSHLIGLFSRTIKLIENGLKLVYVFDGEVPKLKKKVLEERKKIKMKAQQDYEEAAKRENIEDMKKFATRTSRITPEMILEAKKLIRALGVPVVEAPSEGEAQAAFMVSNGDADVVSSQDADTLLFGATRLVRNLSLIGKRKMTNKLAHEVYRPELIDLPENLNNLGIDQKQLIALGMLVGTDFNPNGIKGIGPRNALKLVKKYGSDFNSLFEFVKWKDYFDLEWPEVFDTIEHMPVTKEYKIGWNEIDNDQVVELLVDQHDFSEDRVKRSLEKAMDDKKSRNQKALGDFF